MGCCCFLLSGSVERSENKRLLGRTMPPTKGRVFFLLFFGRRKERKESEKTVR